jgi:hypothetical protein
MRNHHDAKGPTLADIRRHAAVNAHTRASTKAGVALLFTSDALFANCRARRRLRVGNQ